MSLSLLPALCCEVERESEDWGQANADRTSTAALTASFTGTVIGPLMALEKVVKAMKMESVPLGWHSLCHSLLCVYLWIITFSLSCCAPWRCPVHCSSCSSTFIFSPCHTVLYSAGCPPVSLPSPTVIALLKLLKKMVIITVCICFV